MTSLVGLIQTEQRIRGVRRGGGGGSSSDGTGFESYILFVLFPYCVPPVDASTVWMRVDKVRGRRSEGREKTNGMRTDGRRAVSASYLSNNGSLHVIIVPQPEDTLPLPPPLLSLFWFSS
ncbi:hypothetical protein CDEST_13595 [Colletotrichum destructivum]|uniref:Uncharacterized protein n=1 Tax=Colletotrichum destructivum TaxID=34406 RepID=A0AAX4IZR1_9PEZI|nr:hypothetical protein CDEST_13595 [Colletotrichum destructivum]